MSESRLLDLLAARHANDVFVPHCKNGPTQAIGSKVLILDGWALLSTWSPLTCVGYEVKVSRSDWLRDQKFSQYLPLCHLFFVVATKGVVDVAELPQGVGLLETIGTGTGERLVTKRKAARREIDWPHQLMAYALMWRSDKVKTREDRAAQWKGWAEQLDSFDKIGWSIKGRIKAEISKLRAENEHLDTRMRHYDRIKEALVELGLDPEHATEWRIRHEIAQFSVKARAAKLVETADNLARLLHDLTDEKQTVASAIGR